MAVKNFWALTPSEAIVAWELQQRGFHVFFPTKDVGVDLMVLQELNKARRRPITIQVKGSRFWNWKDALGGYGGWFKFSRDKLRKDLKIVDFYIFVLFHTKPSKTGYEKFGRDFFIIPTEELDEKIEHYHKGGDMVNIYLRIFKYKEEQKVIDYRGVSKKNCEEALSDPWRDYSSYLNRWEKLKNLKV